MVGRPHFWNSESGWLDLRAQLRKRMEVTIDTDPSTADTRNSTAAGAAGAAGEVVGQLRKRLEVTIDTNPSTADIRTSTAVAGAAGEGSRARSGKITRFS